ncbi:MogA/MoaB family molybdenum cofactor biosynthesis protein, partial [Streptomyces sp. TRM76130]|nr:MogA/MoaB family molybdenum cofactor biosynthesis protein [Streptomyces sp. TRM76130]
TGGVKDGLAVLEPLLCHAVDQIRGGDHPRPNSGADGGANGGPDGGADGGPGSGPHGLPESRPSSGGVR